MSIPLNIGSDAQFRCVQRFLVDAGFDEDAIRHTFNLKEYYEYSLGDRREDVPAEPAGAYDLCVRLFLEGRIVPIESIRRTAGHEVAGALQALGLLQAESADLGGHYSPVALYPVHQLFIVSDRWTNPDGSLHAPADDMVYAALVRNTNSFLNLMPEWPCERFLDLCSGTGAAALCAARDNAKTAYAFDITERSTAFATFNARLNALPNVVMGRGDAYEPAGDLQFDRIVAHPPYVPVLRHKWTYHSGGRDGEQITRKLIEGLPRHLAPGGLFICLAAGTDRTTNLLENRIREWLGEASDEFDVVVVLRSVMDPAVFVIRQVLFGFANLDELRQWKEVFRELRVTSVVYGPIVIQRRTTPRKVFTLRRKAGRRSSPLEIFWMLKWEAMVAEGKLASRLLPSELKAVPGARLDIEHRLDGGTDWDARRYLLSTSYPFQMECDDAAFFALVTSRLQVPATGTALFEQLKQDGVLHPETDPEEFSEALATLVSGGFIQTSICPLPMNGNAKILDGLEDA